MQKKLSQFSILKKSNQSVCDSEVTSLKLEISQLESEIQKLLERVADADTVLLKYINEKVSELDERKNSAEERIDILKQRNDFSVSEIKNHLTMWQELSFDDKRNVADTLINVIYATSDKITIQWKI